MSLPFLWLFSGAALGALASYYGDFPSSILWTCFAAGLWPVWILQGRKGFLPILLLLLAALTILRAQQLRETAQDGSLQPWLQNQVLKKEAPKDLSFSKFSSINLIGTVLETPQVKGAKRGKVSFPALVQKEIIVTPDGRTALPLKAKVQVSVIHPSEIPGCGDRVLLHGTLQTIPPSSMPFGFDYAAYLKARDIDAVFYGFGYGSLKILERGTQASFPKRFLENERRELGLLIDHIWEPAHAAFFRALILGMRGDIPEAVRDSFVRTGTAHLLAISGLHVSLSGFGMLGLLLLLGYRRKGAVILSILGVFTYAALAGFGIPVRRAAMMLSAFFASLLLEREHQPLNLLFLAAFILVFWEPQVLKDVSFQLSFMSVLSLLLLSPACPVFAAKAGVKETLAVTAGTLPVVLYHFSLISPAGFAANPIVIPIFYLSLVSAFSTLAFHSVPWFGTALAQLSAGLLDLGLSVIEFLGRHSWSAFHASRPGMIPILLYYGALALLILAARRNWQGFRRAGVLGLFGLTAAGFWWPAAEMPFMTIIPGSKGVYAHIALSSGHLVLFHQQRASRKELRWVLQPYLRSRGIQRLEAVVALSPPSKAGWDIATRLAEDWNFSYWLYPGLWTPGKDRDLKAFKLSAGDEISDSGKISVRVLEEDGRGMSLLVSFGTFDALIISNPETLSSSLSKQLPENVKIEMLWMVQPIPSSTAFLKTFLQFHPEVIVLEGTEGKTSDEAVQDARIYNLRETGMLSFEPQSSGRIKLVAHLQGVLGIVGAQETSFPAKT